MAEDVRVEDVFDMDFLQKFQDNFARAVGMSPVRRVIRVASPALSSSVKDNFPICRKSAYLIFAAKPTEAFAAKYWAITERTKPTAPIPTIRSTILTAKEVLPPPIPPSIISFTIIGISNSSAASKSLNKGPSTHSALKSFKYLKSFFIKAKTSFQFIGYHIFPFCQQFLT